MHLFGPHRTEEARGDVLGQCIGEALTLRKVCLVCTRANDVSRHGNVDLRKDAQRVIEVLHGT